MPRIRPVAPDAAGAETQARSATARPRFGGKLPDRLAAHTAAAKGAGLSADQIEAARRGKGADGLDVTVASLAAKIMGARCPVGDLHLAIARGAALDHGLIVEVVASVGTHILADRTNNVARTDLHLPKQDAA